MTGDVLDPRALVAHAWLTLQKPQEGLLDLMRLDLPRMALWRLLILVAILVSILFWFTLSLAQPTAATALLQERPMTIALVEMSVLVSMTLGVFWIGRGFGGGATFENAILAVIWLHFIMALFSIAQLVVALVSLVVADIVGVIGVVLSFYLLTHFIAVIHGFSSLAKVFAGIIASIIGIAFGLSLLLTLIGVTVPGSV